MITINNKILIFLLLLFPVSSSSQAAEKVLCFGDSITEGTYIDGKWDRGNSWVNRFSEISGGRIEAINAGLSGRKTSHMVGLSQAIDQHTEVDHVILFLGVNDLRVPTQEVLDACLTNTGALVKRIREAYPDVKITILSSPGLDVPNVTERFRTKGYDAKEHAMLAKLRGLYHTFAQQNDCHFIDLWGVVSSDNFSDGLHPGTAGQIQIAERIWRDWARPRLATTSPVTQNRDKRIYDWMTRHQTVLDRNKIVKPDIITIGDSITHYWAGEPKAPLAWGTDAWQTLYEGFTVSNMGCGWDRTENVIWRLQNGELENIRPKVAVILIGTNNLPVKNTAEEIYWGIKTVIDEVHRKSPKTQVLLLGLLPRKNQFDTSPNQVNELLSSLDQQSNITFQNVNTKLLNQQGQPLPELYKDGVHVNAAGYAVIAKELRPIIVKLMANGVKE
ncbi:MAG: GDSL-type esterase/lipase family protein [Pirellulales bacterium]